MTGSFRDLMQSTCLGRRSACRYTVSGDEPCRPRREVRLAAHPLPRRLRRLAASRNHVCLPQNPFSYPDCASIVTPTSLGSTIFGEECLYAATIAPGCCNGAIVAAYR